MYEEGAPVDEVVAGIERLMIARHGGKDVTITTQDQMLDVLGNILNVLTVAVAGLGGISLLVGAVGIFTIMTIAVNERTSEIGLLRALGADRDQILRLFLGEATVLAALGGFGGLVIGIGVSRILHLFVPARSVQTPVWFVFVAEGVASVIAQCLAGKLP